MKKWEKFIERPQIQTKWNDLIRTWERKDGICQAPDLCLAVCLDRENLSLLLEGLSSSKDVHPFKPDENLYENDRPMKMNLRRIIREVPGSGGKQNGLMKFITLELSVCAAFLIRYFRYSCEKTELAITDLVEQNESQLHVLLKGVMKNNDPYALEMLTDECCPLILCMLMDGWIDGETASELLEDTILSSEGDYLSYQKKCRKQTEDFFLAPKEESDEKLIVKPELVHNLPETEPAASEDSAEISSQDIDETDNLSDLLDSYFSTASLKDMSLSMDFMEKMKEENTEVIEGSEFPYELYAADINYTSLIDVDSWLQIYTLESKIKKKLMEAYKPYKHLISFSDFVETMLNLSGMFLETDDFETHKDWLFELVKDDKDTILERLLHFADICLIGQDPEARDFCRRRVIQQIFIDLIYQDQLAFTLNDKLINETMEFVKDLLTEYPPEDLSAALEGFEDIHRNLSESKSLNLMENIFCEKLLYIIACISYSGLSRIKNRFIRIISAAVFGTRKSMKSIQTVILNDPLSIPDKSESHLQAAYFLLCVLKGEILDAAASPYMRFLERSVKKQWSKMREQDPESAADESENDYAEFLDELNPYEHSDYFDVIASLNNIKFKTLGEPVMSLQYPNDLYCPKLESSFHPIFMTYLKEYPDLYQKFLDLPWEFKLYIFNLHMDVHCLWWRSLLSDQNVQDMLVTAGEKADLFDTRIAAMETERNAVDEKLKSIADQNKADYQQAFDNGYQQAEGEMKAQIEELQQELKEEKDRQILEESERDELHLLRELLFAEEQEQSNYQYFDVTVTEDERREIQDFLSTHKVTFLGGHFKQCKELAERYDNFRVYYTEKFPAEVAAKSDLIIIFYKWISHTTYYKAVQAASRKYGRVPIEHIGKKNVEASERELLEIIRKYKMKLGE